MTFIPEPYRWVLYALNPMAQIVIVSRWALTGQGEFHLPFLMMSFATVLVALAAGVVFFLRAEHAPWRSDVGFATAPSVASDDDRPERADADRGPTAASPTSSACFAAARVAAAEGAPAPARCPEGDSVLAQDDGLVIRLESVAEFKRARKKAGTPTPTSSTGSRVRSLPTCSTTSGANTGVAVAADGATCTGARAGLRVRAGVRHRTGASSATSYQRVRRRDHAAARGAAGRTGVRPLHRSSLGAGHGPPRRRRGPGLRTPAVPAAVVEQVWPSASTTSSGVFGLPLPTRLKLDVDGFEHKVLAGAAGTLAASRCDVYLELVEAVRDDPHPQHVTAFLQGFGYELARVVEHRPPGVYPRILDALFVRR